VVHDATEWDWLLALPEDGETTLGGKADMSARGENGDRRGARAFYLTAILVTAIGCIQQGPVCDAAARRHKHVTVIWRAPDSFITGEAGEQKLEVSRYVKTTSEIKGKKDSEARTTERSRHAKETGAPPRGQDSLDQLADCLNEIYGGEMVRRSGVYLILHGPERDVREARRLLSQVDELESGLQTKIVTLPPGRGNLERLEELAKELNRFFGTTEYLRVSDSDSDWVLLHGAKVGVEAAEQLAKSMARRPRTVTEIWPLTFVPSTVKASDGVEEHPWKQSSLPAAGSSGGSGSGQQGSGTGGQAAGAAAQATGAAGQAGGAAQQGSGTTGQGAGTAEQSGGSGGEGAAAANEESGSQPAPNADRDTIDLLVDELNLLYAPNGGRIVERVRHCLFLHGSARDVLRVKRHLVLLDAPWPQVQLDMWAVQMSGAQEYVYEECKRIARQVARARDAVALVQHELGKVAARAVSERRIDRPAQRALRDIGFETRRARPFSPTECLVVLAIADDRGALIDDLDDAVRRQLGRSEAENPEGLAEKLRDLDAPLFPALRAAYDAGTRRSDIEGIVEFADTLSSFRGDADTLQDPRMPERLCRVMSTTDRLLKAGMDAFTSDMRTLLFEPLLDEITPRGRDRRGGVALVGKTRLVVTSRLETRLAPSLTCYVETTRPRPLGKETIDLIGETIGSLGASAELTPLNWLQLGALIGDVDRTFTKVAPGIEINVRPTVFPDGASTRLKVDCRFGVTTQPVMRSEGLPGHPWQDAPADLIASHRVQTDLATSAFDLLDISSFALTSTHPRPPMVIPILGRLPVVGGIFQCPRRDKVTHHQSMILANAIILPRAMDLARLYWPQIATERDEARR
jgi:hypothetical protein